jgi:hypothetical protein
MVRSDYGEVESYPVLNIPRDREGEFEPLIVKKHQEGRHKAGFISSGGKKYEVGLTLIGCRIDVIFGPAETTELAIEYEGHALWRVRQLVMRLPSNVPRSQVITSRDGEYERTGMDGWGIDSIGIFVPLRI